MIFEVKLYNPSDRTYEYLEIDSPAMAGIVKQATYIAKRDFPDYEVDSYKIKGN